MHAMQQIAIRLPSETRQGRCKGQGSSGRGNVGNRIAGTCNAVEIQGRAAIREPGEAVVAETVMLEACPAPRTTHSQEGK